MLQVAARRCLHVLASWTAHLWWGQGAVLVCIRLLLRGRLGIVVVLAAHMLLLLLLLVLLPAWVGATILMLLLSMLRLALLPEAPLLLPGIRLLPSCIESQVLSVPLLLQLVQRLRQQCFGFCRCTMCTLPDFKLAKRHSTVQCNATAD